MSQTLLRLHEKLDRVAMELRLLRDDLDRVIAELDAVSGIAPEAPQTVQVAPDAVGSGNYAP